MANFPENIIPSEMKNFKISIDDFIKAYNKGEAELLDIRVPMETKVWQVNFGLQIPANELPKRLNELPKEKLIVVACPNNERSSLVRVYLAQQGFNAKYLVGGLLGLMEHLRGGNAKEINL